MSDEERDDLQQSLTGYKEKIVPVTKATLTWDKDLIFVGRTQQGYEIEFDAHVQWGCKPTDALLLSLAGCMGIDVVMFLQKMRVKLAGFRIDITGERNPTPPQYYKAIDIALHISGKDIDRKKVERAVALSHEKYCSVYNSLRKDIEMKVTFTIEEKEPAAEAETH
ncbi:MAG TPA: OsmC family protein [Dissulfurispiraceae bacterium]|nr:OsmC family protein [Dissulfurispiraceae bacterium]